MISEIGAGKKSVYKPRYEKAQDADPTTTICGMPVVRTATFDPLRPTTTGSFQEIKSWTLVHVTFGSRLSSTSSVTINDWKCL
jgi:hypothetical protein